MMGYFAYRAARSTARALKAKPVQKPETKSSKEIGSTKSGQTAIVIFVGFLFIFMVIAIGVAIQFCNARY